MKELKLPIIKEQMRSPKALSMDRYLEFVQFNLKHTVNLKANAKWKKMLRVNVPFVIKASQD